MNVALDGFHVDINSSSTPYIILPTNALDCICPIILSDNCYNFSSCACFENTPFSRSLMACRSNNLYRLFFIDLDYEVNNVIIHLFRSFRSCSTTEQMEPVVYKLYRRYFKSFQIKIGNKSMFNFCMSIIN